MVRVGREFLGTQYEAHTLEQPGEEQLVVYLRGFDCVTFVENVLALSRCIKKQVSTFEAVENELQEIRYRKGVLDGYPSRLHYFSEWIEDNAAKGVVRNVTAELGGQSYRKTINWITRHHDAYPLNELTYGLVESCQHFLASWSLGQKSQGNSHTINNFHNSYIRKGC